MMFYDQFLRSFGIRQPSDLIKPKLRKINFFDLPRMAIVHYHDDTSIANGPPTDELYLKKITKPVYLGHVTSLASNKGNPRLTVPNPSDMITKYFSKHRRFIRLRDLKLAGRDQSTVIMYNYNMLQYIYRYMRSTYSHYFEWYNVWSTIWQNINTVAYQSERQQFIMLKMPEHLPRVSDLNFGQTQGDNVSQALMKMFNTSERRLILELWKLLGEHPELSMLHVIDKANYGKINLVFTESGRWTFINLGMLMGWKTATQTEIEAAKDNPELQAQLNKKGFKPQMLQKTFLRTLMSVMQVRSVNGEEAVEVEEVDEEELHIEGAAVAVPAPKVDTTKQLDTIPTKAGATGEEGVNLKNPTLKNQDLSLSLPAISSVVDEGQVKVVPSEVESVSAQSLSELNTTFEIAGDVERHIEEDLKQLELMTDNPVVDPNEVAEQETLAVIDSSEDVPLDEAFMKVVNNLADNGVLTGQDYNRLRKHSEEYKTLAIPPVVQGNAVGTMADFIKVHPSLLNIEEAPKIPDIPTVVDKTMLESSLLTFDASYIKNVMQRDIAAMVLNFQKAGIAIRSYDVEKVANIAGAYYVYSVRAVPIEGAPSTWTFRIPVLNEEGEYRSNDVKYNMRKQRSEVPIRKVSQQRVALTSYYGKIFVDRSDKKVNDFGSWVRTQVRVKGLNPEDNTITNIHPADVFNPKFQAPRGFTIMSNGFSSISVTPSYVPPGYPADSYMLNFDRSKAVDIYGDDALSKLEPDHHVLIGRSTRGGFLVLDSNGTVYLADNADSDLKPLMSMEQLLSLDTSKSPIDFVELRFLGKSVPLAVVLSYEMGLTNLMKLLRVNPRRVPLGTRVILNSNEFSIVFNDVTLVFNRDDHFTTLIMAGWNEYHRSIREYDIHEFDRRGVYFNVFDKHGLTVRYLREIDLMFKMYIDPITADLLKEMHEPTEFKALLLRSTSLLTTDEYPEAYQREKGYERMAGAVYTALINSVRSHSGRPNRSKQQIELNPHDVWKAITTDPSNAQVSDINPIQNLKEKEAATFSGNGGRSSRSMVKNTRLYRETDKGVISESTVDSGSVGINVYMSANPRFRSLRGLSKGNYDPKKDGVTSLLSTSALLAPGSDRDD